MGHGRVMAGWGGSWWALVLWCGVRWGKVCHGGGRLWYGGVGGLGGGVDHGRVGVGSFGRVRWIMVWWVMVRWGGPW